MDISSWHVGTGTGVVGLLVVGLIWRSIKFVMKIIALILVLAIAAGAWVGYEYHLTGQLPFNFMKQEASHATRNEINAAESR